MIRKKINKFLATALVLGLSLNTFMNINVFSSFANSSLYAGGTGTAEDPYLISTPEHLNQLRLDALSDTGSKHYKLTNDIDLSGFDTDEVTENGNWTPIKELTGILDGADFSISNVNINLQEQDVGFIKQISSSGIVKNLNLKNLNINALAYIGGLVYANAGIITNSGVQGTITATNSGVGGLVCNNNAPYLKGNIYNSYADVNITAKTNVGGFVFTNASSISNSIAKGSVTATENAGGFAYLNASGMINNSISAVKVTSPLKAGGFIATNGGAIYSSYWDKEVSGQANSYGANGSTANQVMIGLTTSQMHGENAKVNMPSLDFNKTWVVDENGYPMPEEKYVFKEIIGAEPYSSGTGTEADPYIISNAKQLYYLANQVNIDGFDATGKYYKLSNDIDFSNYDADYNDLNGNWTPIGYNDTKIFKGTFDGNNKVIKNLSIRKEFMFTGLFGGISSATIKNVGLENLDINVTSKSGANNLYKKATNDVSSNIGGLVGRTLSTETDSYVNTIKNSYVKGNIYANGGFNTVDLHVGGLVGYANSIKIEDSYSQGMIVSENISLNSYTNYINAGGIVGMAVGTNLTTPVNNNGVLVNNVYSTMKNDSYEKGVLMTTTKADYTRAYNSGLVGRIITGGKLQNSYWDNLSSGRSTATVTTGNATFGDVFGLTTTEMQGENAKSNMQLLDFNNAWSTVNNDYPVLKAQIKAPAEKPTINKLDGLLIELVDNNSEKGTLYYRINKTGNWILYTVPFSPEYDADGNFYLEVKSINASGVESEITVITGNEFEQMDVSKDVAINVNVANSLEVKLSTNVISFSDYNGTQDFINEDLEVTVSSGLPYDINTILTKQLTDKSNSENKIPLNLLGVKTSVDSDYMSFEEEGAILDLVSNAPKGKDVNYNIGIILKADSSIEPANYQGILTFETIQK